jgi:predicted MFS family arabinose efflux permease
MSSTPSTERFFFSWMTPQQKLILFVLSCINFTHVMDFVIMMPLSPRLMDVFKISEREFSFLVSSYTFAASIAGLAGAFFIDRFDRKRLLVPLYTGFSVGTIMCGLAPTFELLMAARVLAGLFGGCVAALIFSVIGDVFSYERRGQATGIVMAAFSVASVAGIPLGLWVADRYDWHFPFLFLGSLGLAVSIFAFFKMPKLTGHLGVKRAPVVESLIGILKESNHLWAYALVVCLMLAGFTVIPFISPYMTKNVGLHIEDLKFIYLAGGLATFVTSQMIGRMADKYGKHRVFRTVALLSIAPILLVTNLWPMSLFWTLVVSTSFMVLVGGRFVPAMAIVTSATSPDKRGGFLSLSQSIQQLSAGIASLIAGHIIHEVSIGDQVMIQNYNLVGYFAAALTVACIYISTKVNTR